MSYTADQVRRMLMQAAELPEGDTKIAALEEVLRHADASGDEELMFDTRMILTSAYQHGGETAKAFVTFSWCLAAFDRDPGAFSREDDALLRWHYKWVVAALKRFPEVPLDRAYRALDDMERRYLAGGHSLHAVYTLRCGVANHIGDLEAGDEWYRKWCTAPRDENSDCVACDPTNKVWHLVQRQRYEEAVAIAEPVLSGRLTCQVQPQSMQAALLLPYLKTGRLDEAREAHRKGYRAIRGNRDYLDELAEHIRFCALSGNEAHGLEILERHLGWLDRPADPMALLDAASAGALLLRRLRELGHGGQRLRRPPHGDRPATEPEVAELEDELRRTCYDLAAAFDRRNGTDYISRHLTDVLASEPIVEYLPLSRVARRRASSGSGSTVSPPSGAFGAGSTATLTDSSGPDTTGPTTAVAASGAANPLDYADVPQPEELADRTPEELLDLAFDHLFHNRVNRAKAAIRRYRECVGSIDPDPLSAARATELAGFERGEERDLAGAERAWRAAAEAYAALGEHVREHVVLGRLGMLLMEADRIDEGLSLLERCVAYLREHGSPLDLARAQLRLAIGYANTNRLDEASALIEEVATGGHPHLEADVALWRGMVLVMRGPETLSEAMACLAAAREGYRSVGDRDRYAFASLQYGRMLTAQLSGPAEAAAGPPSNTAPSSADPEAADQSTAEPGGHGEPTATIESTVAAAADALADAARYGDDPPLRAAALAIRGNLLARGPRAEEAVDDLVEAVALYTELGMPQAAYARFDLAVALANTGRFLDAVETAEEGLQVLEQTEPVDAQAVVNFRDLLVALYQQLGEKDNAVTHLDWLAPHFAASGHAQLAAEAYEAAGGLLSELDRDTEAAQRFATAAECYQKVGDPFGVVRAYRRRTVSLYWAHQEDVAEELLQQTIRLIDELPDAEPERVWWERAVLDYNLARLYAVRRRIPEAIERARAAVEGFQRADSPDEAKLVEEFLSELPGFFLD